MYKNDIELVNKSKDNYVYENMKEYSCFFYNREKFFYPIEKAFFEISHKTIKNAIDTLSCSISRV
jgi:hypothetical protein